MMGSPFQPSCNVFIIYCIVSSYFLLKTWNFFEASHFSILSFNLISLSLMMMNTSQCPSSIKFGSILRMC
jgi:hypothetical protein